MLSREQRLASVLVKIYRRCLRDNKYSQKSDAASSAKMAVVSGKQAASEAGEQRKERTKTDTPLTHSVKIYQGRNSGQAASQANF